MEKFLFIILICVVFGEDLYGDFINEIVSDEYCDYVIGNITCFLSKRYVYLYYLKAPKQPEGKGDYIKKFDLISELNKINKINRTFYNFYADIQNVLNKARDGHSIMTYFFLPFYYYIQEIFDEKNNLNETFLTIYLYNTNQSSCVNHYSNETIERLEKINKILKNNGLDPYEYLEEMGKKDY